MLRLPDGVDDREVAKAALAVNIVVRPLSGYFLRPGEGMSGLLIGYGCVPEEEIVVCGMALGHADRDAPVNVMKTERTAARDFMSFRGFPE